MTTAPPDSNHSVPKFALRDSGGEVTLEEVPHRQATDKSTAGFIKTIAGSLFGILFFLSVVALIVFLARKYIRRRREHGQPITTCHFFQHRGAQSQRPSHGPRSVTTALSSSGMLIRQHTTIFGPFHQGETAAQRSQGAHMGLWNLNDGGEDDEDSRPPPYSFLDPAFRNSPRSPSPFSPPPSPPLPRHPAEVGSTPASSSQATPPSQLNTLGSQAGPPMISLLHVGRGATEGSPGRGSWDGGGSGGRGLEVAVGVGRGSADASVAGRGADASGVRFSVPSDPPPPFSAVAGTPTPTTTPPLSQGATPTLRPTSPASPASPPPGAAPTAQRSRCVSVQPPQSPSPPHTPCSPPRANPASGPTLQLRHGTDSSEITVTFDTPVTPHSPRDVFECPPAASLFDSDSNDSLTRLSSAVDGPVGPPTSPPGPAPSSAPSSAPCATAPSSAPVAPCRFGIPPTSVLNSSSDPLSPGGPQYTPLQSTGTSSSMPINTFPVVPSLLELSLPQSSHGSPPAPPGAMRQQGVQSLSDCNPSPGGGVTMAANTIPPAPPLPPQSVLGVGVTPGTVTSATPPPLTGDLPAPPPYLPPGVPPPPYEPSPPPDHP